MDLYTLHKLHSDPEQLKHHGELSTVVTQAIGYPSAARRAVLRDIRMGIPTSSKDRQMIEKYLANYLLDPQQGLDQRRRREIRRNRSALIRSLVPEFDQLTEHLQKAIEKYRSMIAPERELQGEDISKLPRDEYIKELSEYVSAHSWDYSARLPHFEKQIVDAAIELIKNRKGLKSFDQINHILGYFSYHFVNDDGEVDPKVKDRLTPGDIDHIKTHYWLWKR